MADDAKRNRNRRLLLLGLSMILREFIDDDSSSSSDDEELKILETIRPCTCRRGRRRVPRQENYVEEVIPRMSSSDFQSHFRMKRETFEYVLNIISKKLTRSYPGLDMITPEKQFLLAIWRMATPDSYRSICQTFNISKSTAYATVKRVVQALVALAPALIRWPNRERAEGIWRGFESTSAFPKVLGAIDGTHIHIPAPKVNPEAYVNRKGFHSLLLQGICDHKARFIHCLIEHVGSVHDQRVLRLSEVQEYLGKEEKFPDDCHLVGDPAYKLHQNLLVPYRDNGHLTERQKNFNFCLSSARMAIERAFGLLKGRFRSLLQCLAMTRTKDIPDFVLACCVLHNVCIFRGEELEVCLNEIPNGNNVMEGDDPAGNLQNDQVGAVAKRDLICASLLMRDV